MYLGISRGSGKTWLSEYIGKLELRRFIDGMMEEKEE